MKAVTAKNPRVIEFLELYAELMLREKRISQLETLNARLAKRIDELEGINVSPMSLVQTGSPGSESEGREMPELPDIQCVGASNTGRS